MRIIGIHGAAGSGKDTAAEFLVTDHGFTRIGLADPMKRFASALWPWGWERLWGPSELRNATDPRFRRATGEPLSPRHALQALGTEWGRECDPDVWVRFALDVARVALDGGAVRYVPEAGLVAESYAAPCAGVVIPDVRFDNEANAIRAAGGVVWEVTGRVSSLDGAEAVHVSEAGINPELVDVRLANTSELDDLRALVRQSLHATRWVLEAAE